MFARSRAYKLSFFPKTNKPRRCIPEILSAYCITLSLATFPKRGLNQACQVLLGLLHLPVEHRSFTCILLHLAASSNFSAPALASTKQMILSTTRYYHFHCSSAVNSGYLQNRWRRYLWLLEHSHGPSIKALTGFLHVHFRIQIFFPTTFFNVRIILITTKLLHVP